MLDNTKLSGISKGVALVEMHQHCLVCTVGWVRRQRDSDLCSLDAVTFDPKLAAMGAHDFCADGEAQTVARNIMPLKTFEGKEHLVTEARVNADAIVTEGKSAFASSLLRADIDFRTGGGTVF